MKQMDLNELEVIDIDYDRIDLPSTVQLFKPVLYKNGTDYYCLLGTDPRDGIFGCGESPQEAIIEWEQHLKELIRKSDKNNKMLQFISSHLVHARISPVRPGCE